MKEARHRAGSRMRDSIRYDTQSRARETARGPVVAGGWGQELGMIANWSEYRVIGDNEKLLHLDYGEGCASLNT